MLNWALISNPFNWIIILLMVIIGLIGVHYLVTWAYPQNGGDE